MRVIENEATGETATEAHLRRKAERLASKPKKAPYRIPKVSAKRKGKNKEYGPKREKYLLDHPECEIRLMGCTGKSTQIHHCSTSHKDFLNTETWKACDDYCHNQVERVLSAKERKELKLLI